MEFRCKSSNMAMTVSSFTLSSVNSFIIFAKSIPAPPHYRRRPPYCFVPPQSITTFGRGLGTITVARAKILVLFFRRFAPLCMESYSGDFLIMGYRRHELHRPAWPEAVQILAGRKTLGRSYRRLVGHLRSQRRMMDEYRRHPTPVARQTVQLGRRDLQALIDRYMRTLAELRGAVQMVFPASIAGTANRRTLTRSADSGFRC